MARLTLERISREKKNRDVSETTSLQLSHRALSDVSCLSKFHNLERLDLSCNCLSTLEVLNAGKSISFEQWMKLDLSQAYEL